MARTRAAGKTAARKAAPKTARNRQPVPARDRAKPVAAAPSGMPPVRTAAAPPQATPLGYADLISMVELIERANAFSEFRLKVGAIEIEFKRRTDGPGAASQALPNPQAIAPAAATTPVAPAIERLPASSAIDAGPAARTDAPLPPGTIAITAPMVGTFYRAPAPGEAPFVAAGQRVDAGTTLCIIEVMKLMNTVDAATAGTVVEIRAHDATPVAHDEVLIVFRPED